MLVNAITWLLQRISAVLLVVLLGIHVWLQFVVNPSEVITFSEAKARLVTGSYVTLYILLLSFGLFHALNGLYTVMVDMGLKARLTTVCILLVVGVTLFAVGMYSVLKFII